MNDSTNTKENTAPEEKRKAVLSLENLDTRDYFAAKAMQGLAENWRFLSGPDGKTTVADRWSAEQCYKIADAMIQARDEL